MISLTNYSNGEVEIADRQGHALRLPRGRANSLIMSARMHTVDDFLKSLPGFIDNENLLTTIRQAFDQSAPTERWNTKEKFARLRTLTQTYTASGEVVVVETATL